MARELSIGAKGLMTDPNPLALPPGALRQANNVVIRRHGVIEPRPGIANITPGSPPSTKIERTIVYDGTYLFICRTAAGAWTFRQIDWTEIKDEGASSISFDDPGKAQWAEAAGNLYVTTASGVRRISSGSDTTAYRAGLAQIAGGLVTSMANTSDNWLAANDYIAYRGVLRREVNGRTLRSAPSPRVVDQNTDVASRCPTVTFYLPPGNDGAVAGDVVEIYRSAAASSFSAVPDDMRLVGTHVVTSADVTAGSFSNAFEDHVAEARRGAYLYTNATQQGALQANDRPPKSDEVVLFNNMLLYCGTQQPYRKLLEVVLDDGTETRLGQRTVTGDYSSGTNTITNVSDTTGLEVGMYVSDRSSGPGSAGTYVPANTQITNIAGSTVTMSNNALATAATVTTYFGDFIKVDGLTIFFWGALSATENTVKATSGTEPYLQWVQVLILINYQALQGTIDTRALAVSQDDTRLSLLFETLAVPGSSFSITGTKGQLYSPTIDPTTAVTSETEDRPNRIYYSKLGEPEAVPGTNYLDVGHDGIAIQRVAVIRDVALVFTTAGVYRLSGRTPESLRVDPSHRDLLLASRNAFDVADNRVFAWTNDGIAAVGDTSKVSLSNDVIQDRLDAVQSDALQLTKDISTEDDISGMSLAVNTVRNELYVLVPSSATAGETSTVYVFNMKTKAWTTWDLPTVDSAKARDVITDPLNDAALFSGNESGVNTTKLLRERTDTDELLYQDSIEALTFNSVDATAGTFTITIGNVPEVGDAFAQGAVTGVVTSDEGGGVYGYVADGTPTSGAATGYQFPTCTVEWVLDDEEDPGLDKFWREVSLAFRSLQYLGAVKLTFSSNVDTAGDTVSHSANIAAASSIISRFFRWLVHRDSARGTALYTKMTIKQALGAWQLLALRAEYEPMTERIDR